MSRLILLPVAAILAASAAWTVAGQPAAEAQVMFRGGNRHATPYHFKPGTPRHKIPHAPSHARFRHGAHHPLIHRH